MKTSPLPRRDLFRMAAAGLATAGLPSTFAMGQATASDQATSTSPPTNPPSPAAPARWKRISVGKVGCVIVSDGSSTVAPLQPTFGSEATKEELEAALSRAFHPLDRARLDFTAVLLEINGQRVLIDAGTGATMGPLGQVRANLVAAGVPPESIDVVLITHAHGDHTGGLLLPDRTLGYPNAKILISKAEHDFWTSEFPPLPGWRMGSDRRRQAANDIKATFDGAKSRMELIQPGEKLFPELEILDTNGHTPGHLSLIVDGGGEQLCVLSDVVHNHVVMFANPAWTAVFDVDPARGIETRKAILGRLAAERMRVLAYHLPWPSLGFVRPLQTGVGGSGGQGYEWVTDSWNA